MKLFSYWRSSTSYRVRAALNLKQLEYEIESVDLLAGDQHESDYLKVNPTGGVPALLTDDGSIITQSMVILEFADAKWPKPRLIPEGTHERARQMAVAHSVAMDIHPLNNLRVIGELQQRFGAGAEEARNWMQYWMQDGFRAIEKLLPDSNAFAFGVEPGIADICIAAQAYNAHRWGLDLNTYPKIKRIEDKCLEIPEILAAHPDKQPEAEITS